MKLSERIAEHETYVSNALTGAEWASLRQSVRELESDSQLLNDLIEMMNATWGYSLNPTRHSCGECIEEYSFCWFGAMSSPQGCTNGSTPRQAIEAAVKKWKDNK